MCWDEQFDFQFEPSVKCRAATNNYFDTNNLRLIKTINRLIVDYFINESVGFG